MANKIPQFATIFNGNDQHNFIAKGHIDIKEFNKRLKKHVSTDPVKEDEICYIYGEWKFSKKWPKGYFHQRKPSDKNAKPYTSLKENF